MTEFQGLGRSQPGNAKPAGSAQEWVSQSHGIKVDDCLVPTFFFFQNFLRYLILVDWQLQRAKLMPTHLAHAVHRGLLWCEGMREWEWLACVCTSGHALNTLSYHNKPRCRDRSATPTLECCRLGTWP